MEPESRRTKGQPPTAPFLEYDLILTPAQNYTLLKIYLDGASETELRAALEEERARIRTLTQSRAQLLFRHFERELRRKRALPSQYVYKRIEEQRLLAPYKKLTVEEQALHYAAIDARNALLEKLHAMDMLELAALIKDLRERGLATDAQVDAIMRKVDTQCEPLRDENRRLREQLDARQSNAALETLKLENWDLRYRNGEQASQLTELRLQLRECTLKEEELALLESANAELRQRPGHEMVAEKLLEIAELHLQQAERDNQLETLERQLETARKLQDQQRQAEESRRRESENEQTRAAVIESMERVIAQQDAQADSLRLRLEESQRQARGAEARCLEGVDVRQMRRELDEAKLEYDEIYREKAAVEEEFAQVFEQELDELRALPVYRLDARTQEPRQTADTLGAMVDQKRAFLIVEADALLRPQHVLEGHFMTLEEDALRALLLKTARAQSGRYRVRVTLEDEAGARQLELLVEALAPQKIASFRALELVLDFEQTHRARYVYTGAMPRRLVRPAGQLRVQRYDAERPVGEEALYRFALQGKGVCVVRFDDGALLYASYAGAAMYRLDLLMLPLH
jgi:hypothetical protein